MFHALIGTRQSSALTVVLTTSMQLLRQSVNLLPHKTDSICHSLHCTKLSHEPQQIIGLNDNCDEMFGGHFLCVSEHTCFSYEKNFPVIMVTCHQIYTYLGLNALNLHTKKTKKTKKLSV